MTSSISPLEAASFGPSASAPTDSTNPPPIERIAAALAGSRDPTADNAIVGRLEAPRDGDVYSLPTPGSSERERLREIGAQAIARGEVGVVVLGGGMATRFGGVVKALVPVANRRTFLDLKLADILHLRAKHRARIPFYCMTSFATHAAIVESLGEVDDAEAFQQFESVRLASDGAPFVDDDGSPSRYATGHGDLTFALRTRGVMHTFRERGGKTLFMSNVDNLTATLDEAIIGAHIESCCAVTVEVAPKRPGDRGGAPARVDGVLQIVEGFRFPAGFDQDSVDVFNTNTLVFDAAAIDRDLPLQWFAVEKQVAGRVAWQLERLVGEVTAHLPSAYVRVEREGPDARFQPVKDVDDLPRQAPLIIEILRARGVEV